MKKYLLILLALFSLLDLLAQEREKKETIYSFVPQYLIKHGIRVDIEKQVSPRNFVQICPQFYLSERDEDNFWENRNAYSYLIGGGMNLYHKIFAFEDYKTYGLYLSYGISYNFFSIDYTDYSGETDLSASGTIHKAGADLLVGYQFFIKEKLSIDIYTGLGTRYSIMEADGADTDRFNTGYTGYNYTGNIMQLGIRIGVIL
jgi:hypothetical protein